MQTTSEHRLANAAVARFYLCVGGIVGLHRYYCDQLFESLIYLSTFGVFLLGPVYDVFYLHRIVQSYNDRQLKLDLKETDEQQNDEINRSNKKVPFSLTHFMRQTLFGAYLGLLAIVLAIFLFNSSDRLGLTLFCSLGVALGVWIAGCCGEKCCGFLYALVASLSTAFFTIYWTDSHTIRSLLIIAATSALNSNRSLKWKSSRLQSRQKSEQVISHKQFMFLVSLFVTTLCINWVCFSRTVLQREIGFVPEGSTIRIKSVEVGTFFADYAFERKKSLHTFYPVADHTIDYIPMLKFGANTSNVPWKNGKKAARNTIHSPNVQLLNLYRTFNVELNFFDDQQRVSEFYWLRCVTVFLTDYTRLNLLNETKKDKTEVLKAALWRLYLIHTFDVDPFTSDRELLQRCKPFQKKSDVSTNHQNKDEKTDWALASKVRACTILTNALRST